MIRRPLAALHLRAAGATLALCALLAVSCASGGGDRPPVVPDSVRAWLAPPAEGWVGGLPTAARLELQRGYSALIEQGDTETARAIGERIHQEDPTLLPGLLLEAQAELVRSGCGEASRRLAEALAPLPAAVVDRDLSSAQEPTPDGVEPASDGGSGSRWASPQEGWIAGQLLHGHCSETRDDIVEAYRAFRGVASSSATAERRARDLGDEAVRRVRAEFEQALDLGRIEHALDWLELLDRWDPEDLTTLEAAQLLAAARGDGERELEIVRRLVSMRTPSRELLERQADLELSYGEARLGLDIYRDLAARYPADTELGDRVAHAAFRWRLERMPPRVQEVARRPELDRGDFATLLYFTFPVLRSGGGGQGRIATDILEHPDRDAIVRTLNLGVMDYRDSTLRTFAPDSRETRGDALASLLRVAQTFGSASCLQSLPRGVDLSVETVCSVSDTCRLIADPADCLPGAPISGDEALELVRRAIALLDG